MKRLKTISLQIKQIEKNILMRQKNPKLVD